MEQVDFSVLTSKDSDKFLELLSIFEIEFEMETVSKPDLEYLAKLLSQKNFTVIVAMKNNAVIGGLTIYFLSQYFAKKPMAYLYDIAVCGSFQRKGIGQALVQFALDNCKQQGVEELFVQADIDDGHAIELYRKTKPITEGKFIQFEYLMRDKKT